MLFAAGLGTRLKPFTDHHPKALALVNGKTLLERNLEYLHQQGITEVVVNVFHFADQIIKKVNSLSYPGMTIQISHEVDGPFETGGGLAFAANHFKSSGDPFVVMNSDILTNLNLGLMLEAHNGSMPLATLAVTNRNSSRQFLFDSHMVLRGWQNNKTGEVRFGNADDKRDAVTGFAFSGIHILDPAIFNLMPSSGIFSMTDVYINLSSEHMILGYDHSGDHVLDVGKPEAIEVASQLFT